MVYNGIWFNDESAKKKSQAEFVEHEKHHDLTEDQLKEAWSLMNGKKKVVNKQEQKPEQ